MSGSTWRNSSVANSTSRRTLRITSSFRCVRGWVGDVVLLLLRLLLCCCCCCCCCCCGSWMSDSVHLGLDCSHAWTHRLCRLALRCRYKSPKAADVYRAKPQRRQQGRSKKPRKLPGITKGRAQWSAPPHTKNQQRMGAAGRKNRNPVRGKLKLKSLKHKPKKRGGPPANQFVSSLQIS